MSETIQLANLIDGRIVPPVLDRWLDVFEPATGKVFARCPASTKNDVEAAVDAAQRAAPAWAETAPDERSRLMLRLADLLEQELDSLAELESRDNGKPVAVARRIDIPRAVSNLRFFAAAITQWSSEAHLTNARTLNVTLRQPLGASRRFICMP